MAQAHASKKAGKRNKAIAPKTVPPKSKTRPKQIMSSSSRRASAKAKVKTRHNKMSDERASKQPKVSTSASSNPTTASRSVSAKSIAPEPPARVLRETKTTTAALAMLERGIKLLYQKEFKKSRAEFKALIEDYTSETEIVARARSYIQICDREEGTHKKQTITNDQLYTLGVMEHNRGNFDGAIQYFRQSLEKNQDAEYIHYSLAASLAQKGEVSEAVKSLRRAIELNADNQIYAKNDQDFVALHPNKEFADLVGVAPTAGPAPFSQS